ncbi:Maff2 family protein, partial [Dysosmobacter welbionis]
YQQPSMEVPQSQIAFLSNIPQQGSPRNGSGPYCKKKAEAPDVSASKRPGLSGGLQHNGQVHDLQPPAHGVLHR